MVIKTLTLREKALLGNDLNLKTSNFLIVLDRKFNLNFDLLHNNLFVYDSSKVTTELLIAIDTFIEGFFAGLDYDKNS